MAKVPYIRLRMLETVKATDRWSHWQTEYWQIHFLQRGDLAERSYGKLPFHDYLA